MSSFSGFPPKMRFTPIPNLFFSTVLPEIQDLAELKATLHIFWVLYQKRGYPRFVSYHELAADLTLKSGISAERLRQGLDLAVSRGTLLHLTLEGDSGSEDIYLLNTEADRKAVAKIEMGELQLGATAKKEAYPQRPEETNIFILYEQNIGLVSPMIAEELKEAEKLYPASWFKDAFREAVSLNKRSWRYIARILERWAAEGKDDGELRRDSKADIEPKEYLRRYGHLFKQ